MLLEVSISVILDTHTQFYLLIVDCAGLPCCGLFSRWGACASHRRGLSGRGPRAPGPRAFSSGGSRGELLCGRASGTHGTEPLPRALAGGLLPLSHQRSLCQRLSGSLCPLPFSFCRHLDLIRTSSHPVCCSDRPASRSRLPSLCPRDPARCCGAAFLTPAVVLSRASVTYGFNIFESVKTSLAF